MDLAAIKMECRALMDDAVVPYLITEPQLAVRIAEAINEACTRADLIIDSTTPDVCRIAITAGQNQYPLSPLIKKVLVAKLSVTRRPLVHTGYKRLYDEDPDWMTRTGKPTDFVLDYETNKIILSHVPETDDELVLTVRRLPTSDEMPTEETDKPPFKAEFHYDLIWWVLHLCYMTRDSDLFDPQAADRAEAKFIRRFGERPTTKDLEHELRGYARRAKAKFL